MNTRRIGHKLALVAGAGQVALNRLAIAARVRQRPDGWRRAAGLVLRGENAKFVLSAFGLNVWSDVQAPPPLTLEATQDHLAHRLGEFLKGEPELKIRISRSASEHRAERSESTSYTLGFAPSVQGPSRFVPPQDWHAQVASPVPAGDSTDVLMNFICRIDPSGHADVWVRVDHVGTDGVPLQAMLSRLEAAWGTQQVFYPEPSEFAPYSNIQPCSGRPGLGNLQTFVDFSRLLSWRKSENARLPEPMTLAAAMLWWLAQHPALDGRHMGTTVEVSATDGIPSGVGIVVIRPADYFERPDALARYAQDFNGQVERTRQRASPSCKTLDAAALLSPRAAERLLRHGLDQGTTAFGSLCLSLLKDAKVVEGVIADTGHNDGFIAVGSVALPTKNGRRVGCVTVKGPSANIRNYHNILSELIPADKAPNPMRSGR